MKEWIGSIILFSIFAGIFEAVLPQDRIKKYVRLILGIFLIVIVLEPWIGEEWEVSLSAVDETSVSEDEMVPVRKPLQSSMIIISQRRCEIAWKEKEST